MLALRPFVCLDARSAACLDARAHSQASVSGCTCRLTRYPHPFFYGWSPGWLG